MVQTLVGLAMIVGGSLLAFGLVIGLPSLLIVNFLPDSFWTEKTIRYLKVYTQIVKFSIIIGIVLLGAVATSGYFN